uniref:Uncharacterized protein n=1 Tax=Hucho hucho TaxID=62062 RepID=A0A4W5JWM8_9TELE
MLSMDLQQKSSVQDMKRQSCYISQDFQVEPRSECFCSPEILFCPSDAGMLQPGVHIMAMNSLQKCAPEWQEALMANVALCGGSTMFINSQKLLRETYTAMSTDLCAYYWMY